MTELKYQSYCDNTLCCNKRLGLVALSLAISACNVEMESQMAATVWEPVAGDVGTLLQRRFGSVDEAVSYVMEAAPESIRHIVVISLYDGSIIEPSEIQERYGDMPAEPELLGIEQTTHSAAGVLHLLRSCLFGYNRFSTSGLRQTVSTRLVA
jgi:hypothetical protein